MPNMLIVLPAAALLGLTSEILVGRILNSRSVQQYEFLVEIAESDVATPRHAGELLMDAITKNMKTKCCCDVEAEDEDGVTKICVVCQEDLCGEKEEEEEEIGVLDCGHEYHACCIKNWLMRKNVCPLCNATAVKMD